MGLEVLYTGGTTKNQWSARARSSSVSYYIVNLCEFETVAHVILTLDHTTILLLRLQEKRKLIGRTLDLCSIYTHVFILKTHARSMALFEPKSSNIISTRQQNKKRQPYFFYSACMEKVNRKIICLSLSLWFAGSHGAHQSLPRKKKMNNSIYLGTREVNGFLRHLHTHTDTRVPAGLIWVCSHLGGLAR